MASLIKAKELQDRLESGLARDLGFKIREGDIVLGNFEDLEVGSTVDQKAGKQKIRKVRISAISRGNLNAGILCNLHIHA